MSELPVRKTYRPPRPDELRVLEGKELASWKLAPGDIFYQTPASGKLLLIKRAGELLDEAWVQKMRFNSGLRFRSLVHLKRVSEIVAQWESSLALEDPAEQERAFERFVDVVRAGLHSEGGLTLMDWAFACHAIFKPDEALQQSMVDTHEVLHRRAIYVSALSVLFAMACGYGDAAFLKELYQAAWLLDTGLMHKDFSYWVALACQVEKQRPGAGVQFLQVKGASAAERELFLGHPALGYEFALGKFEKRFQNAGLLQIILHHHELSDGSGFPKGLSLGLLSDWEAILVIADQLVDYREEILGSYATAGLRESWQGLRQLKLRNLPIQRVLKKIAEWSTRNSVGSGEATA